MQIRRVLSVIERVLSVDWLDNTPCDVLIYDSEGSEMIQYCMPSEAAFKVLRTRKGLPLIKSARFFLLLLMGVAKYRRPFRAIVVSILRTWKPKVIITFIDNSPDLSELKRIDPQLMAVSVQNGMRNDFASPHVFPLRFDHYFSFGGMERDLLARGGHAFSRVYPVGSLRAGVFAETFPDRQKKEFDLCFISEHMAESDRLPETDANSRWLNDFLWACFETQIRLFQLMAEFSEANGLTLCVAMRYPLDSPRYEEERRCYFMESKSHLRLIPQSPFSSYKAVRASRLSATITSTLGYEALGLGERVIIGSDIESVARFLTNGSARRNLGTDKLPDLQRLYSLADAEFGTKAKALMAMTDQEYLAYSKEARAYHMNLDVGNPPHEIIKKKIAGFLRLQQVNGCFA